MKIFPLLLLALLCGCAARIDEINVNRWLPPTSPEYVIDSTEHPSGYTVSYLRFRSSGDLSKDVAKMKIEAAKRGANHIVIEPDMDKNIFRARLYQTGDVFGTLIKR